MKDARKWTLHLEAKQRDDPASGVHLLAQTSLEQLKEWADKCGYVVVVAESSFE